MQKRILICHPDILNEVRTGTRCYDNPDDVHLDLNRLEVRTNKWMDKYRKTGRYILPDGSCVLPEDVVVSDRFTEYGYDDIWYLLWAGVIREEQAALFYIMEEPPDFLRQPLSLFVEEPFEEPFKHRFRY